MVVNCLNCYTRKLDKEIMRPEIALINRAELIQDLKISIEERKGFGMGKIGFSEQCLLGYMPFLATNPSLVQTKAYEALLRYHCEIQFGVFPPDPLFLQEFAAFYSNHIRNIDVLGIFQAEQESSIISNNELKSKFIPYQQSEPDRSSPYAKANCYLPFFKGRKILFISPYAELLQFRSQQDIFEGVWAKIDGKWFFPEQVRSIEIPYSFGNSTQTHANFSDSIALYNHICVEIHKHNFDIALIAAGALALPLVSYVKNLGKVGISLGGHLQVLFGIKGGRWANDSYWQTNYFNDSWIDMPQKYHPENKDNLTDKSAYW